jgi:predicted phage terminase large subunit-like protein
MLNDPRDDSTSIIKEAWLNIVDELPPTKFMWRICAIDPAEKTKDINDYTAKAVCYVTENKNIYFVDIRQDKYTFMENKRDIENIHAQYDLGAVPFETNKAFGLFEELKRTTDVPVRERITDKDKLTRLVAVSAFFENSKVFFVKSSIDKKILDETKNQLLNNNPAHDDIRDAIVLAIEEIKRMRAAFVG